MKTYKNDWEMKFLHDFTLALYSFRNTHYVQPKSVVQGECFVFLSISLSTVRSIPKTGPVPQSDQCFGLSVNGASPIFYTDQDRTGPFKPRFKTVWSILCHLYLTTGFLVANLWNVMVQSAPSFKSSPNLSILFVEVCMSKKWMSGQV